MYSPGREGGLRARQGKKTIQGGPTQREMESAGEREREVLKKMCLSSRPSMDDWFGFVNIHTLFAVSYTSNEGKARYKRSKNCKKWARYLGPDFLSFARRGSSSSLGCESM